MIYKVLLSDSNFERGSDEFHLWGEKLLAYGLFAEKGIIYRNEPIVKNPWGKPKLKNYPDIQYNISHSGNCIVCIISNTYDVGIDVEKVRSFSFYSAKRVCSLKELQGIYSSNDPDREFFRYWTLKESYIKAIGKGLSYPMKNVNFEINPDGQIRSDLSDCSFLLIEDAEEFITAVCYCNMSEGRE